MILNKVLPFIVGLFILQACSTPKSNVIWVGGFKTECDDGSEKSECLNVIKGEELEDESWENLVGQIEKFEFEEGMMKKIEVKKQQLNSTEASANKTTVKYTFIKELEKRKDPRIQLKGNWDLTKINNIEVNENIILPGLKIDLKAMRVSGNGGCNLYSAEIEQLTSEKIQLKNSLETMMECGNDNIESEYLKGLSRVESYKIADEILSFYDKKDKVILTFTKAELLGSNTVIEGRWENIRIRNGKVEVKGEKPYITFDVEKMKIAGKDGCNIFNGEIKKLSPSNLLFGPIISTKKMCAEMNVPDRFLKAINQIVGYKMKGNELILLDKKGNELLAFSK